MTNEEAKQQAIVAAWGKWYEPLKKRITSIGSCNYRFVNEIIPLHERDFLDANECKELGEVGYIPFRLYGLKTNNGWTRIEPDGSNLPTSGNYKFLNIDNPRDDGNNQYVYDGLRAVQFARWFTHFKPIKEEPKPIY